MRRLLILVVVAAGCNGFFEDNPDFAESEDTTGDATAADDAATGAMPTSGTAAATSAGTADGSSGGGDAVCEPDAFELNDTEGDVVDLPDIPMGMIGTTASAMLEGTGAVDWYQYGGVASANPGQAKVSTPDATDLRVCVYLKCEGGSDPVMDCDGDEPVTSPSLDFPGCCGIGQSFPTHMCNGAMGGNATVRVRVSDPLDRGECLPYTLDYRF